MNILSIFVRNLKENKMRILITNDDGIEARGIEFLAKQVAPLGDVVVVAPDSPRSGQSCAITVTNPLRLFKVKEENNIKYYKTTKTRVIMDYPEGYLACVKEK